MAALFSGCTSTRYNWSGYEDALYSQYKDPANQVSYMEELQEIVEASAKKPEIRIPPGIYAEYAYMLYQTGRYTEAVVYFRKEHDLWPESRFFMQKMIRMAELKGSKVKP